MTSTLESELTEITTALNNPTVQPRVLQQTVLQIVELYPYIEYMKYLLPGSIALAMFVSVMIGGGMLYIDDKARGVHEGYLVTPITKAELVFGLNAAGAIKAVMTGIVITVIGSLLAGVGSIFNPATILGLALMILLTSVAFNAMMFLLMVRVEDPLVPRATFGILNTLLFFPSGAVYPIQAFPWWLRGISRIQVPTPERDGAGRGLARYGLSHDFRGSRPDHCRAVVQAYFIAGTFSIPAASIMLVRHDSDGCAAVRRGARAPSQKPDHRCNCRRPSPGMGGLPSAQLPRTSRGR
jgi:hypothetical protein